MSLQGANTEVIKPELKAALEAATINAKLKEEAQAKIKAENVDFNPGTDPDKLGASLSKPIIDAEVAVAEEAEPEIAKQAQAENDRKAKEEEEAEIDAQAHLKLDEEKRRANESDEERKIEDAFQAAKAKKHIASEKNSINVDQNDIRVKEEELGQEALPLAQKLVPGISHKMEEEQKRIDAENEAQEKLAEEHKKIEQARQAQREAAKLTQESITPRRSPRLSAKGTGAPAVIFAKPKGSKVSSLVAALSDDVREDKPASSKKETLIPAGTVKTLTAGFEKYKDEQAAQKPASTQKANQDTAIRRAQRKFGL